LQNEKFNWAKGMIMKITVIGTGNMGAAFVKQLARAGHQVSIVARNLEKANDLVVSNPGVTLISPIEAAAVSDMIIIATGYEVAISTLKKIGDLHDKIVIDITNPLADDYMSLTIGHNTSAAEEIAKAIPEAIIVKAFNTVFFQVLANGAAFGNGQTVPVFIASDNQEAKQKVTSLAESIGFTTIDAGGLKNARYLEPIAGFNIYLGYGAGLGTAIAPTWIKRV
jgi:NADPH-dependent F420 reductase